MFSFLDVACEINTILSLWFKLLIACRRTRLLKHVFPHDWIRHRIQSSYLCLWAKGRAGARRCEDFQCLSRGAARYIPFRYQGLFPCKRTGAILSGGQVRMANLMRAQAVSLNQGCPHPHHGAVPVIKYQPNQALIFCTLLRATKSLCSCC